MFSHIRNFNYTLNEPYVLKATNRGCWNGIWRLFNWWFILSSQIWIIHDQIWDFFLHPCRSGMRHGILGTVDLPLEPLDWISREPEINWEENRLVSRNVQNALEKLISRKSEINPLGPLVESPKDKYFEIEKHHGWGHSVTNDHLLLVIQQGVLGE